MYHYSSLKSYFQLLLHFCRHCQGNIFTSAKKIGNSKCIRTKTSLQTLTYEPDLDIPIIYLRIKYKVSRSQLSKVTAQTRQDTQTDTPTDETKILPQPHSGWLKKQKIAFWAMLWGTWGNVCTPSIACCKAHGRLPIRHNLHFPLSCGWDVIIGNLSKSVFFEGRESLTVQISDGRNRRPPTTVGVSKLEWLPFRVVSKYPQCIVWFCHKAHVWQTNGQKDKQTELWFPRTH